MTKASNAERDRVAALEGTARQGGASAAGETTLSLRSNAATENNASRADGQGTVPPTERESSLTPALRSSKSAAGLWLWVAGGFLLLAIGWAILFTVARSAKIESVPLATDGVRR